MPATAGPRWLLQITPTQKGLAAHPTWKYFPAPVTVYDQADRDRRIREARDAMERGEISAFRCDPI